MTCDIWLDSELSFRVVYYSTDPILVISLNLLVLLPGCRRRILEEVCRVATSYTTWKNSSQLSFLVHGSLAILLYMTLINIQIQLLEICKMPTLKPEIDDYSCSVQFSTMKDPSFYYG